MKNPFLKKFIVVLKRALLFLFIIFVLGLSLTALWISEHYSVPIMMYHHVREVTQEEDNSVGPQRFEEHMRYLQQNEYRVISLDDLIQEMKDGKSISRKTVVITFDDGYVDNYTNALPILKKYNFPATVFVPTDLIGKPGYLTWQQLKEMDEGLFDVGSHTVHHAYLPDLKPDEQLKEIADSKTAIEQELAIKIKYFCYPIGGFTEAIKEMLKNNGYEAAVTTNRGLDRSNKDLFELRRIRFSDSDDEKIYLLFKLSGYYNLFRERKNPS